MAQPVEKWCYDGIRHCFARRRERGAFIFAEPPNPPVTSEPRFWLGINAVDKDALPSIRKCEDGPRFLIMLHTSMPVRFCPWCGQELAIAYRGRWQQLYDQEVCELLGPGRET